MPNRVDRAGLIELVLIVVLAFVGVGSVVAVLVLNPENAGVIAAILVGFLGTIITGLFSSHRAAQAHAAAVNASREAAAAAAESKASTAAVRHDIKEVHLEIQGRMTDLLEASGKVERAEGKREGRVESDAKKAKE